MPTRPPFVRALLPCTGATRATAEQVPDDGYHISVDTDHTFTVIAASQALVMSGQTGAHVEAIPFKYLDRRRETID